MTGGGPGDNVICRVSIGEISPSLLPGDITVMLARLQIKVAGLVEVNGGRECPWDGMVTKVPTFGEMSRQSPTAEWIQAYASLTR